MPDGDIMRATLEGTFAGEPTVVGLGFVSGSGAADFRSDADGLYTALTTALGLPGSGGAFMAPLSEHYLLNNIRIQDLSPGVSAGIVYPINAVGGNTTDDATSPHDAMCITWRTGLKGKQYRGRSYLTGFAEDSKNAGYWIGEIQTWANDAWVGPLYAAFGPASVSGYRLSLIHTVLGGARLIPPTATPITDATVNNTVRSLRRRGVGVRISRRRSGP